MRGQLPDLPVLFMTGYAEIAACPTDFLGPGMQLIGKPFTLEALTAAIGQALPKPRRVAVGSRL